MDEDLKVERRTVEPEMKMKNCCMSRLWFVLLWSAALLPPAGAENNSDADALWGFYNGIQEPKGTLANWSNSTSPCLWAGLKCDSDSNVISLLLHSCNLTGIISDSIGNITNLEDLDLSYNLFSGPIPRSISKLTKLSNFTLTHNNLSESIPDDLGSSGSLLSVDLSFNFLSGGIPSAICESARLKVLTLTNNSLTGSISPNITDCQSLERLYLGSNLLEGIIPDSIGTLRNLVKLDLSGNNFVGGLPRSFAQSNLSFLVLQNNQLEGDINSQLGDLTSLTWLSLAENNLRGSIPAELGKLESLGALLLNNNRLSGVIPPSLGNISTLELLDLSANRLTGGIPEELGKLSKLQTLTLRENRLSGMIPSSLQGCASLLDLELSENNLSGSIPPEIGSISLLTYGLNLSRNNLSGRIPAELGQLQTLEVLDLSYNQLEGNVPAALGNLRSLLSIDLAYNKLNGSLPTFRPGMVNTSQVVGNLGLCGAPLTACDRSGNPIVANERHKIHVWAAIVTGIGVALVLIIIGGVVLCYWRLRFGYVATEAEPKATSAEGRLFVDDERPLAFSFEEVVEATQLISEATPIGKGRFSTVYKVIMSSGQEVAVKKLKVDTENSSLSRRFTSELHKIEKMQHRNLLRLLGYVLQGDSVLLLYDFCLNGSLGEWLHRKPDSVLEWGTRYKIAVGAAQGLAFLHHSVHPPFVHRDVSTNNVLLDGSFEPLLGDVGLAKLYDPSKETESVTAVAGSFGYIAPEYAYTMRVTEKSNVYSFGVVLLEMLSGKQPVEPSFGEGCDLVSWVHAASQRNEMPEQLLDPSVSTASFSVRQEMLTVLKVAKLCTSAQPSERPRMKAVVEMLQKSKHSGVQPVAVQKA